jgi:putative oxidoreductase
MMKIKMRHLSLVARLILGSIFIVASYDKITNPEQFAIDIDNYRILPFYVVNFFGVLVPWCEFFCGLLLITGIYWRTSAMIIGFMLLFFIGFLASAMIRGLDIDCGCFGTGTSVSIWRIVEDVIFLTLALFVYRHRQSCAALENLWRKE